MFGLHPNAEIGYLTAAGDALFDQILLIQGGSAQGAGSGPQNIIDDFLKKIADEAPQFDMLTLKAKSTGDPDPFWIVCLQECERMNILVSTIKISLTELDMGLKGQLNITDAMDNLSRALSLGFVPAGWAEVAYSSLKGLQLWFIDMLRRYAQLKEWTECFACPNVLWISGLFNPMSFLTAIMQKTARAKGLPLDKIILKTNVENSNDIHEYKAPAEDGAYIYGFFLDGANWEKGRGGEQGYLCDQTLKDLNPELPVMHVVAVTADQRVRKGMYECPVYVTKQRGPTFVFMADLKMESEEVATSKWVLAGVALLMSAD
jgi:dynein heavy chain